MHQDNKGNMWFGTYDGLNLYNGKNTYIYRYDPGNKYSINGNIIQKITNAGNDYLWISTFIGINLFSINEQRVIESFPQYPECRLIIADETGNTMLLSRDNFISYYDYSKKSFQEIYAPGFNKEYITDLFVDKDNNFFMVSLDGILKRIKVITNGTSISIEFSQESLHDRNISASFYDENHIYFLDKLDHLYGYNCEKKEKTKIGDISHLKQQYGDISTILSWQSDLYIAFKNNGLIKLDKNGRISFIHSNIGVFCIHKDFKQDILWLGTDGQGVQMYYQKQDMFRHIMLDNVPYPIQKPIRTIYTDEENTLWIGTKGDGIFSISQYQEERYNHPIEREKVSHFTVADNLSSNQVFCFLRSSYDKDMLWIGTEGPGLSYYSYSKKKIGTIRNPFKEKISKAHSICEVNDSTLWIATAGAGLMEIIINKKESQPAVKKMEVFTFRRNERICNEFHSMRFDGDSTLFIGSRGGYGVIMLNIYTKKYEFLSLDKTESSAIGDVLSVHKSKDSLYYFGASSGLTQMELLPDGNKIIKQFDRKNGIANDMIHGILEDQTECIWLSTNKGLTKYNPHNNFFHNYYYPDLHVTEFSDDAYWECPYTGKLFFGGINGIVWVDPNEDHQEEYTPELRYWEVKMLNERYPISDSQHNIVIPAKATSFTISFVATDYINGDNYEYSYFLEDYSSGWTELQKNNEVTFMNLPAGKYVLNVKYKNDVYDSDSRSFPIPITVLPPWYLTKWAICIYILCVLLIIGIIFVWVRRRIIKRQEEIARRIKEEQREKLYEAKLSFFTNITHELCTPLTLIKGVSDYLKTHSHKNPDDDLQKYTEVLNNNVDELNILIQEILDFRKIEEYGRDNFSLKRIYISDILKHVYDSFSTIAQKDNIHFNLSAPDNLYWHTDKAAIKKILTNIVSNAFKYTTKDGTVNITVTVEKNTLILKIYNTGEGIDETKIDEIFDRYRLLEHIDENKYIQMTARTGLGLFICKSLVDALNGSISVKSKKGEYAEITVILPQEEDSYQEDVVEVKEIKAIETKSVKENAKETKSDALLPTILVVDDNPDILWFITNTLSSDFEIKEAKNGIEAMKILEQQRPALIITDIMMPQMDGIEFIRLLKADKFTKYIPLIIVSAKITDKNQAEGLDLGADAYITKPFSPIVLSSTIHRLISNKEELKEHFYSPESAYEYVDGQPLHQEDKEFMEAVTTIIKENIENEGLRPELIAENIGLNTRNLYRRFKKITSATPTDYIKEYRFKIAAQLLVTTNLSIQEIIYKVGISNKSYFYREFSKKYNTTPKDYRSKKPYSGQ